MFPKLRKGFMKFLVFILIYLIEFICLFFVFLFFSLFCMRNLFHLTLPPLGDIYPVDKKKSSFIL